MAAAHQHDPVVAAQPAVQPAHVGGDVGRGHLDLARRGVEYLGHPGHHRPEVEAVGVVLEVLEGQPAGVLAVAVAAMAHPDHEVGHPLGTGDVVVRQHMLGVEAEEQAQPGEEPVVDGALVDLVVGLASHQSAHPHENLPLVGAVAVVEYLV